MIAIWQELVRLLALQAAAMKNPRSCPRDVDILKTRIADLEEMTKQLDGGSCLYKTLTELWQHQELWNQET